MNIGSTEGCVLRIVTATNVDSLQENKRIKREMVLNCRVIDSRAASMSNLSQAAASHPPRNQTGDVTKL